MPLDQTQLPPVKTRSIAKLAIAYHIAKVVAEFGTAVKQLCRDRLVQALEQSGKTSMAFPGGTVALEETTTTSIDAQLCKAKLDLATLRSVQRQRFSKRLTVFCPEALPSYVRLRNFFDLNPTEKDTE